jgi:hypothetical protein
MRVTPPTPRTRHWLSAVAIPVAVLLAAGTVWMASYAAFSADTRNSGNSWATGQVTLTDDDNGSARFNVSGIVPDQTDTKCIVVTSNSTVSGVVKTYVLNAVTSSAGLENHILISVSRGTGGSFASPTCAGFTSEAVVATDVPLATLITTNTDYASGLGSWTTTGTPGEAKTYRITWKFDTTGLTQEQLDALQGAHTGVDFEWEIQSS